MSDNRLGPTRARDLLAVAVIAAAAGYLLTRFNYNAIPRLPRFAGLTGALVGLGEAVAGFGLRRRIKGRDDAGREAERRAYREASPEGAGDWRGEAALAAAASLPAPVPPLTAARALAVAKATALAGAALAGLWIGFGAYVLPDAARAVAPAADAVTAVIGVIGSLVMVGGALWLEFCCRTPRR